MAKLSVANLDVKGKRVLLRCDFNVPLDDNLEITDDVRIVESLPTIKHLLEKGARLIVTSHLGRPDGQRNPEDSLKPVAARLSQLLGRNVPLAPDCVGAEVKKMVDALGDGDLVLLENVRYHKEEEEKKDKATKQFSEKRQAFAKELASYADLYVNDAFGTAHRDHVSTCGVAQFLKPRACGFLIQKELKYLQESLDNPKRPLLAILGGAKISTKVPVIEALLAKVDYLYIAGGMTYTFAKAQGYEIGKSLFDADAFETAKTLLERFKTSSKAKVVFPVDALVTDSFEKPTMTKVVSIDKIPAHLEAVDIGPESIRQLGALIGQAATIVWNGPVGVFEKPEFAHGTKSVCEALVNAKGITIIGGGDSAAAAKLFGITDKVSHVSTGGGASLEFLEGKKLPGIAALDEA